MRYDKANQCCEIFYASTGRPEVRISHQAASLHLWMDKNFCGFFCSRTLQQNENSTAKILNLPFGTYSHGCSPQGVKRKHFDLLETKIPFGWEPSPVCLIMSNTYMHVSHWGRNSTVGVRGLILSYLHWNKQFLIIPMIQLFTLSLCQQLGRREVSIHLLSWARLSSRCLSQTHTHGKTTKLIQWLRNLKRPDNLILLVSSMDFCF